MAYIYFPDVPPINGGIRTASDHKDWLNDLLDALEDTMFAVFATNGGMTGVLRSAIVTSVHSQLLVQAKTVPSMYVQVLPGVAIGHTNLWWLRSTTDLGPMTAPVTNPRWDLVQAEIDNRQLSIKTGTESATPSKPPADANAVALASIYHRVGETVITNTDDGTNGYIDVNDRVWAHPNFSLGYCFDVDLTGMADGDILVYRSASGKFKVETPPAGTGSIGLDDLTGVDLSGLADNDILIYNETSGNFEPGSVPAPVLPDTDEPMVLTAQGLTPAAAGGCADPAVTETSTNKHPYWSAAFDGGTNEVGWFCNIALPVNYKASSKLSVQPIWTAAAGTAAQTVIWKIAAVAFGNDDALDAAFTSNVATISDALITTGDVHIGPATELTINGTPAANKLLTFRIERDAANDTLTGDVEFLGLLVTYTGTQ
jgi:hypothetical protein